MENWALKYWVTALFGATAAGLGYALRCLWGKFRKQQCRLDAFDIGIQALLDDRITQIYYSCVETGYCPAYLLKSVMRLWTSYKTLANADDDITQLVDELKHMQKQPTGIKQSDDY